MNALVVAAVVVVGHTWHCPQGHAVHSSSQHLSAAFASSEEVCEALRWCQRSDRAPSRSTIVPTITKSKERLDEWEPHVKHYASSRLEAAGRAKLAKGAAAVMFALTWLVGGHFPKS